MRRSCKIALIGTAWGASALLAGSVFVGWLVLWPKDRIVAQWVQPPDVHYHSNDPYTLYVTEAGLDISTLPWRRTHEIVVGRTRDYGYLARYSFNAGGMDLDAHLRTSKIEWSEDGVTLVEATGQRLFIPKALFIRGR